jgi:hypothetical protein
MNAISRLVDRARLRNAPPQVQEGYELYRDLTYRGMVIGNAAFHALPHHQETRRLPRAMRSTDPTDTERLDQLLREIRAHHAEFDRIRELERPITPWGRPRGATKTPASRTGNRPRSCLRPQTSRPSGSGRSRRMPHSIGRFPAGHDALWG